MTDYNDGKIHGWNGGDCPVHPETVVKVWLRDEDWNEGPMEAGFLGWAHDDDNCDIIAFQVDKQFVEPKVIWVNEYAEGAYFAYDTKAEAMSSCGPRATRIAVKYVECKE